MIDHLVVMVSRHEVEVGNTAPTIGVLSQLLVDVATVRQYRERVDIVFEGYDTDTRELCEVPEVRSFVAAVDRSFPYWLYFLTRKSTGLQAVAFCFLPPYLTDEAQRTVWPQRLTELVDRRWGPALADITSKAGWSEADFKTMLDTAGYYFLNGPR